MSGIKKNIVLILPPPPRYEQHGFWSKYVIGNELQLRMPLGSVGCTVEITAAVCDGGEGRVVQHHRCAHRMQDGSFHPPPK